MMIGMYKVNAGYENPKVYIESPVDVYKASNGQWLVEDCVKGSEWLFDFKEDAETFAAAVESWYEFDAESYFNTEGY